LVKNDNATAEVSTVNKFFAAMLAAGIAFASQASGADGVDGTHRFIEVRGAKLYTQSFGHGPPIVFLHGGLLFFDNNFAKQKDYFAANRTVIGIDQRGHGHSPDGPWSLSYQEMAEDTAAVIAQLGVGPVDIVGHSDGGNIALLVARDHPQLVRRVVISGANLRSGLTAEQVEERSHWSQEKLRGVADSLPPWFRTDYAKVSPDGADHWMKLIEKCYHMWIQPVVIEPGDLKKISARVLVMAGDHDFTSIEETTEIYRGLPKGQLIIVPATGHGTFLQRPDLVNLSIREFLDQPDGDAPAH
jgi:pimeloyl-ACP methyl ester carboxylesterase